MEKQTVGYEFWKSQRKQWLTKELEGNDPEQLDAQDIRHLKDSLLDEDYPVFESKVPLNQMVETLEEIWDEKEGQCSICSLM